VTDISQLKSAIESMNYYAETLADDIATSVCEHIDDNVPKDDIDSMMKDDREFVKELNTVLSAAKKFLENLIAIEKIMQ
jgi:hypothetical protein